MTKPITKQTKAKASTRKPRQPAAMTFEEFAGVVQPGASSAVYDVRLIDIKKDRDECQFMIVEHSGRTYRLKDDGPSIDDHGVRHAGMIGCIKPSQEWLDFGCCIFSEYPDQSLRRAPELDITESAVGDDGRIPEVIGWRCDARREGFRTPADFVPGKNGQFVPDETVPVSLRVPPEFTRICKALKMTPERLLRRFVGDLSRISNYCACPRADGYTSNGSDERALATEWLYRAH